MKNFLLGEKRSLVAKLFSVGICVLLLWTFVTHHAVTTASAQVSTGTTVALIGTITSVPATQNGFGLWHLLVGEETFQLFAVPDVTFFFTAIPAVGDSVHVVASESSNGVREIVSMMIVNTEPPLPPAQPNMIYATISGSMLTASPSASGIGQWRVLARSGRIYNIDVYTADAFTHGLPDQGADVHVAGWQMTTEKISADTVAIDDGSEKPVEVPEHAVFALSGEVVGEPLDVSATLDISDSTNISGTVTRQRWHIRDGADIYRVYSDDETVFTPTRPTAGTYVHMLAIGQPSDESLRIVEMSKDTFTAGEIVIRLQPGIAATEIAERYAMTIDPPAITAVDIYRFTASNPTIRYLATTLQQMNSDPDVLWAELSFRSELPIEGHPHRLWGWGGPDSTSYQKNAVFDQLHLNEVHSLYRGTAQVVAVLDTGVDLQHWDLQEHLLNGIDLVDNDDRPEDSGPGAAQGHGTHISGIVTSVAPDSWILPVRVLDPDGRGDVYNVAYAITWAVKEGADVINLSQGTDQNSRILYDVIRWATEQGVSVVAAAGNSNSSALHYPAAYADVLAVTAADNDKRKADFANYGAWIDVAAPGVAITSTIVTAQGSGYAAWSGTSMAAPFVSGTLALVRQKYPDASVATLHELLQTHGDQIDDRNISYHGLVGTYLNVEATLPVSKTYIPLVINKSR